MIIQMETPEWIIEHGRKCVKLFGLEMWSVSLVFHDAIDGDSSVGGKLEYNYRYWLAWINLRSDIKPDDEGYQNLTHEYLHLAMSGLSQAIDSIMQLIPKNLKDHCWDLWKDGNEQTVARMDSLIATLLRETALVPDAAPVAGQFPQSGSDETVPTDKDGPKVMTQTP